MSDFKQTRQQELEQAINNTQAQIKRAQTDVPKSIIEIIINIILSLLGQKPADPEPADTSELEAHLSQLQTQLSDLQSADAEMSSQAMIEARTLSWLKTVESPTALQEALKDDSLYAVKSTTLSDEQAQMLLNQAKQANTLQDIPTLDDKLSHRFASVSFIIRETITIDPDLLDNILRPPTDVIDIPDPIDFDPIDPTIPIDFPDVIDIPDFNINPKDDIVVLASLQIETRFDDITQSTTSPEWRLRVRVYPDETIITRHNPNATPEEYEVIETFWKKLTKGMQVSFDNFEKDVNRRLQSDNARAHWEMVCGAIDAGRATWLATQIRPVPEMNRAGTRRFINITSDIAITEKYLDNRVVGLPPALELWVRRNGTSQQIAVSQLSAGEIPLTFPESTDEADEPWYYSFDKALSLGLAFDVILNFNPADIEVLYVVGAGGADPTSIFEAHIASGEMSIIQLDSPTNSVIGTTPSNPTNDIFAWLDVLQKRRWQPLAPLQKPLPSTQQSRRISRFLTGNDSQLPAMVGDGDNSLHINQTLVKILYPALWGHNFNDIWGFKANAHPLAEWAADNLYTEGSILPIRIDDQPYGILPVTLLSEWVHHPNDPKIEADMAHTLHAMRSAFAERAQTGGTVVGSDTDTLINHLARVPQSARYRYRARMQPHLVERLLYEVVPNYVINPSLLDEAQQKLATIQALTTHPDRLYISLIGWRNLKLPLVRPIDMDDTTFINFFQQLIDTSEPRYGMYQELVRALFRKNEVYSDNPLEHFNSLLTRLTAYSYALAGATATISHGGDKDPNFFPPPLLEDAVSREDIRTIFEQWANEFEVQKATDPATQTEADRIFLQVRDGIQQMHSLLTPNPTVMTPKIERVMRSVLDTAMYRIDPWITGLAYRRLNSTISAQDVNYRFGLYGWVENPLRDAIPAGPRQDYGVIHTPSESQTLSGVILRDRFLASRRSDPNADTWNINLQSDRVQITERLIQSVRDGEHIYHVLGREIENLIGTVEGVQRLRLLFPLYEDDKIQESQVCDGLKALQTILQAPQAPVFAIEGQPMITADILHGLGMLNAAIDVYADLLVTDAVYHVVEGRPEVAGASMNAASGLASPPTLDVLQSPREGRAIGTSVMVTLQFANSPTETNSIATLADPTIARFVGDYLGNAEEWAWEFTLNDTSTEVRLSELGLTPIDTVNLSTDDLMYLVQTAISPEATYQPTSDDGTQRQQIAKHTVQALSGDIFLFRNVVSPDDANTSAIESADLNIRDTLCQRFETVYNAVVSLLQMLSTLPSIDDGVAMLYENLETETITQTEFDIQLQTLIANRPQLLLQATTVGIMPLVAARQTWDERINSASDTLQSRLDNSPISGTPTSISDQLMNSDLTTQQIARAIAELASSDGKLAILSPVNVEDYRQWTQVSDPEPELNQEWLTMNAVVRPMMAQLEAWLLEAELFGEVAPIQSWINRPNDYWQTNVQEGQDDIRISSQLNVAYAEGRIMAADNDTTIAVSMLDSWNETIPMKEHDNTVAFGFNAPAARPQQAILIAVPPKQNWVWTNERLVSLLEETRQSTHARMATVVSEYSDLLPTAMLRATGNLDMSFHEMDNAPNNPNP